ncbi:MAG TPA: hypothetical protein VKU85_02830, partial [bacterium]|nr:hypothetical protein [bacterium]
MSVLAMTRGLRASLSILAPVVLAVVGGALIYQAVTRGGGSPGWSLLLPAVPVVVAVLVFSRLTLTLAQLRTLELALVAAAAVFLAAGNASRIETDLLSGNAVAARSGWNTAVLHFVALMILYGFFVPGTRVRIVAVIAALALVPFAMAFVLQGRHGGAPGVMDPLLATGPIVAAVLQLALGATVAVLGAHLIG